LTVTVGTKVTVTNDDKVVHTWTADGGAFNSGMLQPGASFSFTFMTTGSYGYHCLIHTFMTGTVVVN